MVFIGKIFKLLGFVFIGVIVSGCSTSYELKKYQDNLNKSQRGVISGAVIVADAHCSGLEGHDGNTPKTFFYPNASKCLFWWDKYVTEVVLSNDQEELFPPLWNWSSLLFLGVEATKIARNKVDKQKVHVITEKIHQNYNPYLAHIQYKGYAANSNMNDSKEKRAVMAKMLCDNDELGCSAYASYAYDIKDYQTAASYYDKSKKSNAKMYPITFDNFTYNYNLADLIVSHHDLLSEELKKLSPYEIKKSYFSYSKAGNKKHCKTNYYIGNDDCTTFSARNYRKEKILLEAKFESIFLVDKSLPLTTRRDKYKLGITRNLKNKNYAQALVYFDFLERTAYQLPDSMVFYRAEAYQNTNDRANARKSYIEYVEKAGKSGAYYRKALSRMNEL